MQEILHTMKKKKGSNGCMIIKIDVEKTYDRLSWDFVRDNLIEMRLLPIIIDVIMRCITSCSIRILGNGEVTKDFRPSCVGNLGPHICLWLV